MADTAPSGSIKAGGAYVEIFTVDGPFHKGLNKAQKSLDAFSQKAMKAGAALSAAAGTVLVTLTATAKAFADQGDKLDKMSQRTGVAVESLSALDYAAGLSGTSLERLEDSLKDMSKNLVDAGQGSQGIVDTLTQLGITAESLNGKGAESQLLAIADALSKIPDTGMRATLAMKLFGEGGRELLPLFAGGAESIRAMMKEAKDLGRVMSTEDAKAAAQLQEELNKLNGAFEALKINVGSAVAKELTDFLKYLNDASPAVLKAIGENKEWVVWVGKMAVELGTVGIAMGSAGTAAYALSTAIGVLRTATIGLTASLGLIGGLGALAALALITKEIYEQATMQGEYNRELQRSIELREKLSQANAARTDKMIEESRNHGGDDRNAYLQQRIKAELNNLDTKEKRVKELEAEASRYESMAASMSDEGAGRGIYQNKADAIRKGDLADEQSILKSTQERLQALQAELMAFRHEQATQDRSVHREDLGLNRSNLTYTDAEKAQAGSLTDGLGKSLDELARRQKQEAAKLKQALEQEAEEVAEAMLSPAEKLQKKLEHLKTLQAHGLSDADFEKAAKMARVEAGIETANRNIPAMAERVQNAAAVERGSQEAFSAMVKAMNGRQDIESQIEKNTKDTARETKLLAKAARKEKPITVKVMNF